MACAEIGTAFPDADAPDSASPTVVDSGPVAVDAKPPADSGPEHDVGPLDEGPRPADPGPSPTDEGGGALDVTDGSVEDTSDSAADLGDTPQQDTPLPPVDEGTPTDTGEAECDDENVCTTDFMGPDGCVNQYTYGICCTANPMCDDADPCTDDLCVEGMCEHVGGCCAVNVDCQDGETTCTLDYCVEGQCINEPTGAPACCTPNELLIDESFDEGSAGVLVIENTSDDVGWHVSTGIQSESPPGSLWYGNAETMNYDSGTGNSGTVTLPTVALPGGVEVGMTWDLFLSTEYGTSYDILEVQLTVEGSDQVIVVWDKSKALYYNAWFTSGVDLTAFGGKTVELRFAFDTQDEVQNTGLGVFIDNLQLGSASCTPRTCATNADCNDLLGATLDLCVGAAETGTGTCAYKSNTGYCTSYLDCDDGVPCTANSCSGNQCNYPVLSNCCQGDDECDDSDPCTLDDCVGAFNLNGGYCQHIAIPECCVTGASCNDGDPCTFDSCPAVGQPCAHTPIAGCCAVNEQCGDADPCTDDLCVDGGCQNPTICCADDTACDDGDDLCTSNSCVDGVCQTAWIGLPGCCMNTLLFSNFGGASFGSFPDTDDPSPGDGVGWVPVVSPAHSAGGSLHYGSASGGDYNTGLPNKASITSTPVSVPALTASHLSFWLLLDNEYANNKGSIEWDRLRLVALRIDTPGEETLLWDSAWGAPVWWAEEDGTRVGGAWTLVDGIDLTPLKGRTVRFRFDFDTIDADANNYAGAFIDDVLASTACGQ